VRNKKRSFDVYVRQKIDEQDGIKGTPKENGTTDDEAAVRIFGNGINSFSGVKFVQYSVWEGNKPDALG